MGLGSRVALAAVLAATACAPAREPPRLTGGAVAAAPRRTRIDVLSAGEEPRRLLRYSLRAGRTERWIEETHIELRLAVGPQTLQSSQLPVIRGDATLEALRLLPNGNLVGRVVLRSADVAPEADTDPGALASIQEQQRGIPGISFDVEATPRGDLARKTYHPSATMTPENADESRQRNEAGPDTSTPFPDVPVGRGARWHVSVTSHEGGYARTLEATCELRALTGDRIVMAKTYDTQSTADGIDQPMAASARMRLRTMAKHATLTSAIDLQALAPSSETLDGTWTITWDIAGAPTPVTETRVLHETITRVAPPP